MRMTIGEVLAHQARVKLRADGKGRFTVLEIDGCNAEADLHTQIIAHCNAQWPPWNVIHARMDKASTLEAGAPDFTIQLPAGRTLCVECKTKSGKLSEAQRNWAHKAKALGHTVHVVRSLAEFLALLP